MSVDCWPPVGCPHLIYHTLVPPRPQPCDGRRSREDCKKLKRTGLNSVFCAGQECAIHMLATAAASCIRSRESTPQLEGGRGSPASIPN